jgi:C-terminal processing protease CtpA/Prc
MVMLWLTVVLFAFIQCRKEVVPPVVPPVIPPVVVPEAAEVNSFVWTYMHDWYLWNDKVPGLTNTYYQMLTKTSPNYQRNKDSLNAFLNKYSDPSVLFNDILYQHNVVDKWSFIESDYTVIENWINNVSKSMGFDYRLYRYSSNPDNLFGVVQYVLPGTPADKAGIKRGNLFTKIGGTQPTISNYQDLIAKDSYSLTLATLSNNTLVPSGESPVMTAVEITEDPVFLSKVLTVNGAKVGYLVYNGFTSSFDLELNTAFQQLKNAGITKLILDLRYNGGGSVQSSVYLASMIYTTNTSKLFAKSVYNSILTPEFNSHFGASYFLSFFADKINTTAINSLNLSDIYFIVSGQTASASELLINGLKPYMNVKLIGTTTVGKYVASTTLYDYAMDSSGNLIPDGKGGYVKVSNHKYAMQPIIAKYSNSLDVSDFVNGFTPDINAPEDIGNMLPLGDENETMLKATLDNIKGLKSQGVVSRSSLANSRFVFGSKERNRFSRDMYVDPQILLKRKK